MIILVTSIPGLATDALEMIKNLGFNPHIYKITTTKRHRYNIRLSKKVGEFIRQIKIQKS